MTKSSSFSFLHLLRDFFVGILVGIANIIPGVSGGTFALVLGIYERLLNALHAINGHALKVAVRLVLSGFSRESRRNFVELLRRMDALFLAVLGMGAIFAILSLSFIIDWLLTYYPALTLSFFVGLIIPSIAIPWKMMGAGRSARALIWMIPGMVLTILVSFSFGQVGDPGDNLLWCFITGAIAISAMILPGISGSFVMMVMGQYQNILRKLQSIQTSFDPEAWIWLGVYALGCVAGLILFSRLLRFLINRFRVMTLAFLIGLILGSFWILWPFKHYQASASGVVVGTVLDSGVDGTYQVEIEGKPFSVISSIPAKKIKPGLEVIMAERDGEGGFLYSIESESKRDILVATAPNRLPTSWKEVLLTLIPFVAGLAGALAMNRLGKEEMAQEL